MQGRKLSWEEGIDSRHMGKSLSRLPLPVGQQGNKTAIDFPSGEGFTNER